MTKGHLWQDLIGKVLVASGAIGGTLLLGLASMPRSALAVNECLAGGIPPGSPANYVTACGQGPFTSGITYGNAETANAVSTIFTFDSSQVSNPGNVAGGNKDGVLLSSNGAGRSITVFINQVPGGIAPVITGGGGATTLNASGFRVATTGATSAINFTMNAGSITGGTAGTAQGVRLTTTGATSPITFALNGGTITGGSSIAAAQGVFIQSSNSGSDIKFASAASTLITAANGSGVQLNATGGSNIGDLTAPNIAANTINGTITSTLSVAGSGTGTGLGASATGAGGIGNVGLRIGTTGIINGSGSGLVGSAGTGGGAGGVTFIVDGHVNQTSAVASPLSTAFIPIGVSGTALGSGNVTITANAGSGVTQVGHVNPIIPAIGGTEGVGISGVTNSGTTTITANGQVSATGVGVGGVSASGTSTVNVGGQVTMTATAGGPSTFLGGGFIPIPPGVPFVGDTVGAYALSGSNAATTNLVGGNISSATDLVLPDIGLASVVLSGTAASTIKVGDGAAQASGVTANNIGLFGLNLGSGTTNVNSDKLDPEGDQNTVTAGGIGLLGIGIQNGAVNVSGAAVNVSGANPLTVPGIPFALSGGLVGISLGGGNVDVNAHGNIAADGATFGAMAFSMGGSAVVTSSPGINIDPIIGMAAVSINGAPTADAIVNNNANVTADLAGLLAVGINSHDVTINNNAGASSISDLTSMALISFGNTGVSTINNHGFAQGNGILAPVVFALTDNGVTINNFSDGEMRGNLNFGGEPLILSLGGGLTSNNSGIMTGTITALALTQNNVVNNNSGGTWTTSLLNTLGTFGDNTINNHAGGTINSQGLSTFLFLGDENTVNNSGVINVTFFDGITTGFTSFLGVDTFNNAGGTTQYAEWHLRLRQWSP